MPALLIPHSEIPEAREGLGDQSLTAGRRHGRCGALGVACSLLAFSDLLTSVDWLYLQTQSMFRFTHSAALFTRAGKALPEAMSEYSQHVRMGGF